MTREMIMKWRDDARKSYELMKVMPRKTTEEFTYMMNLLKEINKYNAMLGE